MTFIETYTGRRFYPLDPNPSDVCIEDVAHALAMTCRFNGHVRKFYSVAEHSVHVSRIVPPEYALAGLLHDASEAYIADVSRPIKRDDRFGQYNVFEGDVMQAVWGAFDLNIPAGHPDNLIWWDEAPIKVADNAMLALEARSLLPYDPWMDGLPEPADVELGLWGPEEAERRFMERYAELT